MGRSEGFSQFLKPEGHSLGTPPTSLVMPHSAGSLEGGAHCPVTWRPVPLMCMGLTAP